MLKIQITKIKGSVVTVLLPDGQSLNVSSDVFEGAPKEGMSAGMLLIVPGSEDAGRQKLSKDILNELMSE